MDRFKGCRTSTDDDVHSEQLSTVPCVQVTEQIDQSIRDNLETSVHHSVFGFMSQRTGTSRTLFATLYLKFWDLFSIENICDIMAFENEFCHAELFGWRRLASLYRHPLDIQGFLNTVGHTKGIFVFY
jgi:hypothetical protein